MPLPGRIFANDEELGKKDDEYRPSANGTTPVPGLAWTSWKMSPRMRRRRVAVFVLCLCGLYLFFKNLPTDLLPVADRIDTRVPGRTFSGLSAQNPTTEDNSSKVKSSHKSESEKEGHYFGGEIQFLRLGASLQATTHTMGYSNWNKNVAFIAANVQSASRLLPLACEMARFNRNVVHFIYLGRDDVPIDELKEVNGITEECEIFWHDARPDFAAVSTDNRFETSVSQGLLNVHLFLHPQVYLTDDLRSEEGPFVRASRSHGVENDRPIISLPFDASRNLKWMTRMDSGSLREWHNTYVNILIDVPPGASGSLIRLLQSIQGADYFGVRPPHITIELPPEIEESTSEFLDNFVWPLVDSGENRHDSRVTIRKRVIKQRLTPAEASVHLLESFYPLRTTQSHVLLLSPQIELSPFYYHYVLFNILEYRHSTYNIGTKESKTLMGVALTLPQRLLDDKTPLEPPRRFSSAPDVPSPDTNTPTSFLWQAPDTRAALYFGDKWKEMHSFLSYRLSYPAKSISPKLVSATLPGFAEPLLELMRARGYFMLFPGAFKNALAIAHNELYHIPEEFMSSNQATTVPSKLKVASSYTTPKSPSLPPPNSEYLLANVPLHVLLPTAGDLPELTNVPILSFDATVVSRSAAINTAKKFTAEFRTTIGNCSEDASPRRVENAADDLFCVDGESIDDENDSIVEIVPADSPEDDFGSRDGVLPTPESPDGSIPVGFGSASARAREKPGWAPGVGPSRANEVPVSDEEKAKMKDEQMKHLDRQKNGRP